MKRWLAEGFRFIPLSLFGPLGIVSHSEDQRSDSMDAPVDFFSNWLVEAACRGGRRSETKRTFNFFPDERISSCGNLGQT